MQLVQLVQLVHPVHRSASSPRCLGAFYSPKCLGLRSILPATPFAMHACCFACEGVVGVLLPMERGSLPTAFEARRLPPAQLALVVEPY